MGIILQFTDFRCEDETEKNDKPLNEHVSDFEGKLVCMFKNIQQNKLDISTGITFNQCLRKRYLNVLIKDFRRILYINYTV